jgi:hypothetical protein
VQANLSANLSARFGLMRQGAAIFQQMRITKSWRSHATSNKSQPGIDAGALSG